MSKKRPNLGPLFTGNVITQQQLQCATSEHDIQLSIVRELQRKGWLVLHINGAGIKTERSFFWSYIIYGFGSKGFPDLLSLKGTQFLLFEIKRHNGKLTDSQIAFINVAKHFNIAVQVFDNWDDAHNYLQELK